MGAFAALAAIYGTGLWAGARALRAAPPRYGRVGLLALAPWAVIPAAALLAAPLHYEGRCFGFPDSEWACGPLAYTGLQAFYGLIFSLTFNVLYAIILGLMALHRRLRPA